MHWFAGALVKNKHNMVNTRIPEKLNKILILNVAGIGDFLESVSSLKHIKENLDGTSISLLTSSRVYPYAKDCPYVDKVYSFPVTHGSGLAKLSPKTVLNIFGLLLKIRKEKFDAVINLYELATQQGAKRMSMLIKLFGIKYSIGRNTENLGEFFSFRIKDFYSDNKNHAFYFDLIAKELTNKDMIRQNNLWINQRDKNIVSKLFEDWKIKSDDFILAINPGFDCLTRKWELNRFSKIIDYMNTNHNTKTIILGAPHEIDLVRQITNNIVTKAYVAAGKTNISQLIEIISRSKLLVSTNSAAIHIAGITGVPFVSVSGSSNPTRSKPSGDDNKMVLLWEKTNCNPCLHYKCPQKDYMKCMDIISTDKVIQEAKTLISRYIKNG